MTTSAAKDMFLPPLTTLVTRLIETTSSFRLRRFASIFFFIAIMSCPAFWRPIRTPWETLEVEARFAGCVGESFNATMVEVTATIENHLLDALLLRALGDEFANFSSGSDVAAVLLICGLLAERRSGGDSNSVEVVDELSVDVVERAIDVEARALGCTGHLLADASVDALADDVARAGIDHSGYSFLVAYSECWGRSVVPTLSSEEPVDRTLSTPHDYLLRS